MRPSKLLLAIVTVLAVTGSVANAAPVKGKQAGTYTVQDTRWTHQDLIEDEARTTEWPGFYFL
jgi:hypothetical protein